MMTLRSIIARIEELSEMQRLADRLNDRPEFVKERENTFSHPGPVYSDPHSREIFDLMALAGLLLAGVVEAYETVANEEGTSEERKASLWAFLEYLDQSAQAQEALLAKAAPLYERTKDVPSPDEFLFDGWGRSR